MIAANVLFTVLVHGVTLQVLECQGRRFLATAGMVQLFGYRSAEPFRMAVHRHSSHLIDSVLLAKVSGKGRPGFLFDEKGVRYFHSICRFKNDPGPLALIQWLDAGGLQVDGPTPESNGASAHHLPTDPKAASTPHSGRLAPPIGAPSLKLLLSSVAGLPGGTKNHHGRDLRLVPDLPYQLQLDKAMEKDKAYCRDLHKTLLRYLKAEEVQDLTDWIEARIDTVLEDRHCPGLNAARYELYRKYWLQGGDA